ncbi:hypothetical protein E8E12_006367 [Didymella heteroderae]|uniref:Xylanolytic transcriptional activator regulatory domain-containing protein n=1 Tax=Didymella heteroderae TaxID=1769908 RepID=A0A9P4WKP0_9PLEO|nr:hypothetical protein E8E12_006367 [Didymella heteroderae]
MSLDDLRTKSPVLLLSVLVYTVTQQTQGTDAGVHDELVKEAMYIIGNEIIGRGQRSIELVQALLVAAFWSKTSRKGQQGSCYQLIQLATDMAIDLGIAGPGLIPSPVAYFDMHENTTSLEARRTWLACFIVRIMRLIDEVSSQMCLCQSAIFVDGNDYNTHATISHLRAKIDAWADQIPSGLALSQTLKVWYHVAMIHLHEVVLHTPTNTASFTAPFLPHRIVAKGYPKPVQVIPPLQSALKTLAQHCHAAIDTVAAMDPALVLSLPTFCFAPSVLYSLFVLVNLLVVSTDPANTYGRYLARDKDL